MFWFCSPLPSPLELVLAATTVERLERRAFCKLKLMRIWGFIKLEPNLLLGPLAELRVLQRCLLVLRNLARHLLEHLFLFSDVVPWILKAWGLVRGGLENRLRLVGGMCVLQNLLETFEM